jgi:hypothetical protein
MRRKDSLTANNTSIYFMDVYVSVVQDLVEEKYFKHSEKVGAFTASLVRYVTKSWIRRLVLA